MSVSKDGLIELLERYQPEDASERAMVRRTLEFVGQSASPCDRQRTEVGHITASAWVVDLARTAAVLVHHAGLGMWFQPGGHTEPSDDDLLSAALREAREETALAVEPLSRDVFDVDVHSIPARGATGAHLHFDIRFVLGAQRNEQPRASAESREVRWVELGDIAWLTSSESVLRMVRKTTPDSRLG